MAACSSSPTIRAGRYWCRPTRLATSSSVVPSNGGSASGTCNSESLRGALPAGQAELGHSPVMSVGEPREHPAYLSLATAFLVTGQAREQAREGWAPSNHPVCLREGLADQPACPQRELARERRIRLDGGTHPDGDELSVAGILEHLFDQRPGRRIEQFGHGTVEVSRDAVTHVRLHQPLH